MRPKINPLFYCLVVIVICLCGCSRDKQSNYVVQPANDEPVVKENGSWIEFPSGSKKAALFLTEVANIKKTTLGFLAPATVIGRVHQSSEDKNSNLILFNSPELTSVYSSYLQNQTLLKTSKLNFDRVNDLYKNGAATGKELNDASAELLNIKTSLAENEAKLRESGLNPENLNNSPRGTVWLICDLPESEMNVIKKGQKYMLEFPSFPNEFITANIDVIAEVMNMETRKLRVRLSLIDPQEKIRPGMYANVRFEMPHQGLMVPKKAVFSSNAKFYVFIMHSLLQFERREVSISTETGDYIEISEGLKPGENVVTSNVFLLKGICLGI